MELDFELSGCVSGEVKSITSSFFLSEILRANNAFTSFCVSLTRYFQDRLVKSVNRLKEVISRVTHDMRHVSQSTKLDLIYSSLLLLGASSYHESMVWCGAGFRFLSVK